MYCKQIYTLRDLCVGWTKKKKRDEIAIIRWDHIEHMDKHGKFCRNIKLTNIHSPYITSTDQARREITGKKHY